MTCFVLAMDGGGVRGVLQARLIERLHAATGFLGHVDFVAGTSIGGIAACFLAKNRSCDGLVDLFKKYSSTIFGKRDFLDGLSHFDELVRANYGQEGLLAALRSVFGEDETLGDLALKCMVVTFDLDNFDQQSIAAATTRYTTRSWKPKYGHNFDLDHADAKTRVIDWCLRTSAAPTYFPSHQGYVDGGVIDNNPSAAALAKVVKQGYTLGHNTALLERTAEFLGSVSGPEAVKLIEEIRSVLADQIHLLSIGTGMNPHYIPGETHDYGYKQWLSENRLLNMLFDGMLGPPDYMCSQMLNGNYHRVNPTLAEVIDLAEVDKIDDLIEVAENVDLEPTVAWLRERCPTAA